MLPFMFLSLLFCAESIILVDSKVSTRATHRSSPSHSYPKPSKLTRSSAPAQSLDTATIKDTIPRPTGKGSATGTAAKQNPSIKATKTLDPSPAPGKRRPHTGSLEELPERKPLTSTNKIRREASGAEQNGRSSRTAGSGLAVGDAAVETNPSVGSRKAEQPHSSLAEENLVKLTMRLMKEDAIKSAVSKEDVPATVMHHGASDGVTLAAAVASRSASKSHARTPPSLSQEVDEQKIREHIHRIQKEAEETAEAEVLAAVVPESESWSEAFLLSLARAKHEETQAMVESIAARLRSQEGLDSADTPPPPDNTMSPPTERQAHTAAGHLPSRAPTDSSNTKPGTKHSPSLVDTHADGIKQMGGPGHAGSRGHTRRNATSQDPTTSKPGVPGTQKLNSHKEPSPETMSVEQRLRNQQRQLRQQQLSATQRGFPTESPTPSVGAHTNPAQDSIQWSREDSEDDRGVAVGEGGRGAGRRMQGNEQLGGEAWVLSLLFWRLCSLALLAALGVISLALLEMWLSGLALGSPNGAVTQVPKLALRGSRRIFRSLLAAKRAATLHVNDMPRTSSSSSWSERGAEGSGGGSSGGARMLAVAADATGAFAGTFFTSMKTPERNRSSEYIQRRWTGDGENVEFDSRGNSFTSLATSPTHSLPLRFSTTLTQPVYRSTSSASSSSCASHCAYNIGDISLGPTLRSVSEVKTSSLPYYESQA